MDKYLRSLTDPFLSLFVALRRVVLGILRAKTLSPTPKNSFLKDIYKKGSSRNPNISVDIDVFSDAVISFKTLLLVRFLEEPDL